MAELPDLCSDTYGGVLVVLSRSVDAGYWNGGKGGGGGRSAGLCEMRNLD